MSEPTPAPFPLPQVLQPERPHLVGSQQTADRDGRISLLQEALDSACQYGKTLWQQVESLRAYLLASLPPDPRVPGPHQSAASPTGPDDEQGWQRWMAAYAAATSALAGPQGDSGFGARQARQEADLRRNAPNIRLLANHPALDPGRPEPGKGMAASQRLPSAGMVLGIATATLAARHLLVRQLRPRP